MEKEKKKQDNSIYLGSKSVRVYFEAIQVSFEEEKNEEVILKARGKNILTACNVAEFAKRKDEKIKIKEIKLGSESFKDEKKDKDIFVSSIEIILVKSK